MRIIYYAIGLTAWIFGLLLPTSAGAQLRVEPAPETGVFLVAHPAISDPRFQEAVILLLKHDETGSLGLIVNRRTDVALHQILPEADQPGFGEEPVFIGGPVSLQEALVLVLSDDPPQDSMPIFGRVHLTGIDQLLNHSSGEDMVPEFHIYVGHAGWAPGQLREEVEMGVWRVEPADEDSVFDPDPDGIWERLKSLKKLII